MTWHNIPCVSIGIIALVVCAFHFSWIALAIGVLYSTFGFVTANEYDDKE